MTAATDLLICYKQSGMREKIQKVIDLFFFMSEITIFGHLAFKISIVSPP